MHVVTIEFKENKECINYLIKVIDHFSKKYKIAILWPNVDYGRHFISKIGVFLNKNKKGWLQLTSTNSSNGLIYALKKFFLILIE